MNINSSSNFNRAPIIPRRRKSIHDHGDCRPFVASEAMVRYGLNPTRNTGNSPSSSLQHTGRDEVDQVMSKLEGPYSPTPNRRKTNPRRNSLRENAFSDDFSLEDANLSKSLPASLPSYYSDDDVHEEEEKQNQSDQSPNGRYESHPLLIPRIRTHESADRSQHKESDESINRSYRRPEPNSNQEHSSVSFVCKAVIFAVIALLVCYNWNEIISKNNHEKYDEKMFFSHLNDFGEKYKISHNSILQVQSGIATIFDREDTGSFIFVYNSKSQDFNKLQFEDFINDVATTAAKYLRNQSTGVHHLVLESKYLNMNNHMDLMNMYRKQVDETGVMLVKELEDIPSKLAMAFHYYCDEYNPLVKKSAIFFTLDLGKCTSSNTGRSKTSHGVIEKCLTDKWQGVPVENMKPLLTRVVNIVVDVYNLF